ncbi:multicopper oxidase domain-containing protein [Nonomuraea fuscirosea]|uniref:multicopper oxidase domain-containing protein n=1 Tax=Nonomuraea fuscirosea TaxID=1291556 RepID=UPI00342DBAB4
MRISRRRGDAGDCAGSARHRTVDQAMPTPQTTMNRRQFLAATALTGLASACGSAPATDPAAFRTEVRVPPLLEPTRGKDGTLTFALTMRRGRSELLPGGPVETWGFNGAYLGPTIRAARGDKVRMTVTNRLAEARTRGGTTWRSPTAVPSTWSAGTPGCSPLRSRWTGSRSARANGSRWWWPSPAGSRCCCARSRGRTTSTRGTSTWCGSSRRRAWPPRRRCPAA